MERITTPQIHLQPAAKTLCLRRGQFPVTEHPIAWPCATHSRTVPPSEFAVRASDAPLDIGAANVQNKGDAGAADSAKGGFGSMIKVGVCGFGYWGPNLLRNLATNPGFCPVAVAERREAYRANAATLAPNLRL